jgi:iron complex transport system permease protein
MTGNITQRDWTVLSLIRMPRVAVAMFAGAALSISGTTLQGVSRNPLVGPETLGVCSGAGFGAAFAILFLNGAFTIQVCAFLFGLAAVLITYLISASFRNYGNSILTLILAGIAVSAIFSALIGILEYIANPYEKLPTIMFWLLGSFSAISWSDVPNLIPMAIGIVVIVLLRWRMNILSLGEEEARTLGLDYGLNRSILVLAATLATAAVVATSGIIAWVGLIVPHITRRIVGPDHKMLIPATISVGAVLMVVCDTIARTLYSFEIPIGIVTSLVGAPIFLLILRAGAKRKW